MSTRISQKTLSLAVAVGLVLLAVAPAARATDAPPARRVVDRIVALVGQEVITGYDVDAGLIPYLPLIYRIDDPVKRMEALELRRSKVLDELVNEVLVLEEAARLELPVSSEEVEAHIRKTRARAGWSEAEMEANLKQLGYPSLDAYREKTRKEMLKAYAFQIRVGSRVDVTTDEVEAEFKTRHPGGKQEQVRARHILVRLPEVMTLEELNGKREELRQLRERIVAGEIEFDAAARTLSEHAETARYGGDLGFFSRYVLDEVLTANAFALRVGEISDVIQSSMGFHVIELLERRAQDIDDFDREEIMGLIHKDLTTQESERVYRQWIREMREQAFVEIRLKPITAELPPSAPEGDDSAPDEGGDPERPSVAPLDEPTPDEAP